MLLLAGCGKNENPSETGNLQVETIPAEIKNGRALPGYYYENNLTDSAADPFILEHDGTYYLYSTGGSKFTVRTSKDLVVWQTQSEPILKLSDLGWAKEKGGRRDVRV